MKSYAITDKGIKRRTNQDYVFATDEAVGNLPNLYIVADGMGGHKAGDFASKYTVGAFIDAVRNSREENPISIIDEAVKIANTTLIEKASENVEMKGMGTTLVVATIIEDSIYIANVGDSRLYLIDDDIHQITRDHSLVEEMVNMGELDKKSARTHEKKNIITRAVGADLELIADYFEIEYSEGDIILMCSDGLSNMIEDEDIRDIIIQGNPDKLEETAHKLIDTANNNGGKDNIAVVLVKPEY
ncbi:Stp1/IreP family PP2C-type Ser/Thr phosphatase [Lachnospiraceae bacterium HCP1S3_C3]|nr:Stp1/IreP family PP2C-type Ser/Thr phosphatase [Lachnospiraceae bacterium]MDD6858046.1 Stp1/IreP family PP2C-type Ser/Thr phosphatase [Lachnospiraceae bacterium]